MREAKPQFELSLATGIKDNRKDFYRYIANKRKTRSSVQSLQKETEDLVTMDKEKAETVNDFCARVLNGKYSSHAGQDEEETGRMKIKSTVGEDQAHNIKGT